MILTSGARPSLRSTAMSPAPSSHASARYLALRSRPKRSPAILLKGTDADRISPAAYHKAMPACSDLPGKRAAVESQSRGTGPRRTDREPPTVGGWDAVSALPGAVVVSSCVISSTHLRQQPCGPRCDTWGSTCGPQGCTQRRLQWFLWRMAWQNICVPSFGTEAPCRAESTVPKEGRSRGGWIESVCFLSLDWDIASLVWDWVLLSTEPNSRILWWQVGRRTDVPSGSRLWRAGASSRSCRRHFGG